MPREILWIAFNEKPPAEVRVELMNLSWRWNDELRRWEWRGAGSQPKRKVVLEVQRRMLRLGYDLRALGKWGVGA